MSPRLGLRSRILALTMPVVILAAVGIAGIVYFSLGQILEVSALDIAQAEVLELKADLFMHSVEDLSVTHEVDAGTRASQIVDSAGHVVVTTDPQATAPLVDPVGRRRLQRPHHQGGLFRSSRTPCGVTRRQTPRSRPEVRGWQPAARISNDWRPA